LVKNAELYVTDHELDVVKQPGEPAQIVDEDEFIAAATRYGYSQEFQAFCHQVVREALTLVDGWIPSGWHNR
jgi:predicted RNA-binding protein associated with RNAse of E/G family